jgi:hypothetical protein
MRMIKTVPKTNLEKLAKEVLSHGPNAALPKNLPDRWLRAIGRDLLKAQKANLEGREDDPSLDLTGPILLVAALFTQRQSVPYDEACLTPQIIKEDLDEYAIAITDEIIGRETGVFLKRSELVEMR